jgi:hypothetical protein
VFHRTVTVVQENSKLHADRGIISVELACEDDSQSCGVVEAERSLQACMKDDRNIKIATPGCVRWAESGPVCVCDRTVGTEPVVKGIFSGLSLNWLQGRFPARTSVKRYFGYGGSRVGRFRLADAISARLLLMSERGIGFICSLNAIPACVLGEATYVELSSPSYRFCPQKTADKLSVSKYIGLIYRFVRPSYRGQSRRFR